MSKRNYLRNSSTTTKHFLTKNIYFHCVLVRYRGGYRCVTMTKLTLRSVTASLGSSIKATQGLILFRSGARLVVLPSSLSPGIEFVIIREVMIIYNMSIARFSWWKPLSAFRQYAAIHGFTMLHQGCKIGIMSFCNMQCKCRWRRIWVFAELALIAMACSVMLFKLRVHQSIDDNKFHLLHWCALYTTSRLIAMNTSDTIWCKFVFIEHNIFGHSCQISCNKKRIIFTILATNRSHWHHTTHSM